MALKTRNPFGEEDPAVTAAMGMPAGEAASRTAYQKVANLKQLTNGQRKKLERDAARTTATFDFPPALLSELRQAATTEGVPLSGLVTLLIQVGMREWQEKRWDLRAYKRPTRSMKFDWQLEINLDAEN